MSTDFVKPAVGAVVAILGDKYILNNQNMNSNAVFGASVGIGIYASSLISPNIPKFLPDLGTMASGKALQDRVTEISLSSGSAYIINRYVMQNDYNSSDMMKKLGIIVAADFIGEYASDYFGGRALSYFQ
jgi:hypothetical protein